MNFFLKAAGPRTVITVLKKSLIASHHSLLAWACPHFNVSCQSYVVHMCFVCMRFWMRVISFPFGLKACLDMLDDVSDFMNLPDILVWFHMWLWAPPTNPTFKTCVITFLWVPWANDVPYNWSEIPFSLNCSAVVRLYWSLCKLRWSEFSKCHFMGWRF